MQTQPITATGGAVGMRRSMRLNWLMLTTAMSNLMRFKTTIDSRMQATAQDAVAATAEIDRFTDLAAQAIAARIDEIPESIAAKVAAYSDANSGGSLIGLLLKHLLKTQAQPKYVPVSAIAPAVESALADFTVDAIDLSEWRGETIDLTDW